ncbi:MAG: helix-turn-helix transcriptional regulator [Pirellulaceae bacterium]|nr:helix-turn-helix transcriptional regulator [Pirellulaceae bacterium]
MSGTQENLRSHCPVNYGLEAFGDRWALLILRDIIFRGKRKYGDFLQSEEGVSTNILASRLTRLVEEGILERAEDENDGRKSIYKLTPKGLDLIPVIFEIILWSAKYDKHSQAKLIPRLVQQIKSNNRELSGDIIRRVANGEAILKTYLD